jgi:hypothetical protein
MQFISVSVNRKNDKIVSPAQTVIIDIAEIVGPIRTSPSGSYFSTKSQESARYQNKYVVNESLATIQAQSTKLILLRVTERNGFSVNNEMMIFDTEKVFEKIASAIDSSPLMPTNEFLYFETSNENYVSYKTTTSLASIFSQTQSSSTDIEDIDFACSDETTAIQSGDAKITLHAPYDFMLLDIFAGLTTPELGGDAANPFVVDVNKNGTSVLSTKISIEPAEETSLTAATQPVISTPSFTKGDKITVDVDQISDGTTPAATGLKVYMKVQRL